ncbi:MAG TPA: hypothetical protein ENI26_08545 [Methylophaga aminisulfidivorans]|uniref:Uncharacterized protein n=2 Tax=root TaxID=1 RepID=A0A7C1ZRQ2_9GAMM|nr:hypothetical protein [Methylophaga aminisulfidivorans]
MESISVAFSVFLSTISGGMQSHVSDVMGSDIQTQVVKYQDYTVDYQYKFWKVRDDSVCAITKHELVSEYSECTVAAKSFFIETCSHLTNNKRQHWKHKKLENMYCSAAVSYEPTIAQISIPTAKEAKLLEAQQACSMLTLQARQTQSKQHATQRDRACAEYKALTAVTE